MLLEGRLWLALHRSKLVAALNLVTEDLLSYLVANRDKLFVLGPQGKVVLDCISFAFYQL